MKLPGFPQRQVNGTVEVVSAEECQASGDVFTFHSDGFVDCYDDSDLVEQC